MAEPEGPGPHPTPLDPSGELRGLVDDCVHCGFCLPACPTYQLWGEEMDSPRGRIHLMSQILDGAEGTQAAARRGVLLVCAVVLSQAGAGGQQAYPTGCCPHRKAGRAANGGRAAGQAEPQGRPCTGQPRQREAQSGQRPTQGASRQRHAARARQASAG